MIVDQKNTLQNMAPALEQIQQLKREAQQEAQPTGLITFAGLTDVIKLNKLSFSYPDRKEVLCDITMVIPKGTMVAIVGKSGSGKTTLTDLIMGLYHADQGDYCIDGTPFAQINVHSWRQRIGYVPQDSFLFNSSIRDNLLWSNENAGEKDMWKACQLANAEEFIEQLPQKYDTMVGERGVILSGGQRQRIALARAMLRKPELLILDEATSSLDSHSEFLIQNAIERISKEATLIVVAHRLSTIRRANYIYVLDKGKIVEEGTFEKLMNIPGGAFWEVAQLQGMGSHST